MYSLYSSAKLDPGHIQHLPQLAPLVSNRKELPNEKALIFLQEHCPERLSEGFPVRAIVLPRVTGRPDTRYRAASPAACLTALAPSTVFQLAGAGSEVFRYLSAFVRQVPSYVLDLGTDLSGIPDVVLSLLSEVPSR